MRERCPVCGLLLERGEEGYQVGSYMLNIIVSELVPLATFIVVLVVTWPDPPWVWLQYGIAALAIVSPFLIYPFTKTFFLAMDLVVRPPTADELRPEG